MSVWEYKQFGINAPQHLNIHKNKFLCNLKSNQQCQRSISNLYKMLMVLLTFHHERFMICACTETNVKVSKSNSCMCAELPTCF